jgi:hypothetical protein
MASLGDAADGGTVVLVDLGAWFVGFVVTSCGRVRACSIVVQNVVADAMSRRFDTYTSITWPCWSTAGETYCQMPATLTEVSSTNQEWHRHCVGMAVPRRRVTV